MRLCAEATQVSLLSLMPDVALPALGPPAENSSTVAQSSSG